MRKKFSFKLCRFFAHCSLLTLYLFPLVCADDVTEQQIKLGFIYNFAKFVSWPNVTDTTTGSFVICVIGSQPLTANLALLQGKKLGAQSIKVSFISEKTNMRECNMLFMSEIGTPQSERILLAVSTLPVLTVSDKANFIQEGGMIGMKEMDNRLRFDINLAAAKKTGLAISSQLLSLADEVVQ